VRPDGFRRIRRSRNQQSVEKALHGFFNIAHSQTPICKSRIANGSDLQWPAAIKNGGTSLYRTQPVEKQSFSTGR
jgi:hypothetical protein